MQILEEMLDLHDFLYGVLELVVVVDEFFWTAEIARAAVFEENGLNVLADFIRKLLAIL